jgi:hypothetical protein
MREIRLVRGVENEPTKKGELKKPESKLEKVDRQLEKVENRTSNLIAKHITKEEAKTKKTQQLPIDSTQSTHKLAINSPQTINKTKREASFYTYVCMPPRRLPRKILDHVKANAWPENGEWFSRIDSYELSLAAEINAHQIGNTVRQLRDEGFFEIVEHSTSGYRLLKINPIIFGIKQS